MLRWDLSPRQTGYFWIYWKYLHLKTNNLQSHSKNILLLHDFWTSVMNVASILHVLGNILSLLKLLNLKINNVYSLLPPVLPGTNIQQQKQKQNRTSSLLCARCSICCPSRYCPLCRKTGFSCQPCVSKLGSTKLPA